MSSEQRIRASRANGALSRGPRTEAGKARSSQNALRHGLLADIVVLKDEPREPFQALWDGYVERFGPLDSVEYGMVEEMAATYWRMRRAWAAEHRMLDKAAQSLPGEAAIDRVVAAFSSLADSSGLGLLHRYETRLHMMFQRAFHNLLLLRRLVPESAPAVIPNEPRSVVLSIVPSAPQAAVVLNEPRSTPLSTEVPAPETQQPTILPLKFPDGPFR
jgi:hypothetical protein